MIFYNIMIGILVISSVGFIALDILDRKIGLDIIESPLTLGILGIVSIISICLSKYFIVELIPWVSLSNFTIVFIAFIIFYIYMKHTIECGLYGSRVYLDQALVVTCPAIFFGVFYIFERFVN